MKPERALYLALTAIESQIKTLNPEANMHQMFGAKYPEAVLDFQKRNELREAAELLREQLAPVAKPAPKPTPNGRAAAAAAARAQALREAQSKHGHGHTRPAPKPSQLKKRAPQRHKALGQATSQKAK